MNDEKKQTGGGKNIATVLAIQKPFLRRNKMHVLFQAAPDYLAGFKKILSSSGSRYRIEPAGEKGYHVHYKTNERKEKKVATLGALEDKVVVTFHKPIHEGTNVFRNHFESYANLNYQGSEQVQAANKEAYQDYFRKKGLFAKLGLVKRESSQGQNMVYAHGKA